MNDKFYFGFLFIYCVLKLVRVIYLLLYNFVLKIKIICKKFIRNFFFKIKLIFEVFIYCCLYIVFV